MKDSRFCMNAIHHSSVFFTRHLHIAQGELAKEAARSLLGGALNQPGDLEHDAGNLLGLFFCLPFSESISSRLNAIPS